MVNTGYVKDLIVAMGFAPLDGTSEVYAKAYPQHNDYIILVDFANQKINYITQNKDEYKCIRVWDSTTSNFAKPENFVVLECVDRLLSKGYAPNCIELEKRYPLGRREKGCLDVLVNSPNGTPYILIECKTWGAEFEKEQSLMNRSGGQLFSYYANERAAEFLCLYASKNDSNALVYKSAIVPVEPEWVALSGTNDIVKAWSGNFKNNGIFEADKTPYNITHTALTHGELQTITEEHSEKIFDLIMEILRHNVVSDKPNAFNKLLNLFICKIIDEDRQPDEVVDFQLLESDGKYNLQMRLNDLYQKGMWRFLNIRVTDYSEREIDELTAIDDETRRKELKDAITKLRLQKNPEFAFVEVCDDKTFEANDKILREIVGLLHGFKFRYAQKHQFLGDFFELLLSTSIKQESGQFFTPVPITRFILSAMPLKLKVDTNVAAGEADFLPTVIDYACGSGHFLTEYLECMQNIIDTADFSKAKPSIKKMVRQYQDDGKFSWADKYVYGIDLDYRLVKTTKVSAFFNGDGEAQIIWANGLGNFEQTPEFLGKLRNVSRVDKRDNASFDILISNPPYSVDAFKATLDCGEETFELFNDLTDKSKEVECLFVERMKQILKVDGWAGIILPSSIMTNGGIHAKAREILFKYFKFKAIAEMGSGTFMKTDTNTVILFLERRENTDWQVISRAVDKFFEDYRDVTVLGIEQPFSKYALDVRGEQLEDYSQLIQTAEKEVVATEKDKLLYFILTCSQTMVLIKSGQKQDEKEFLGYEFSERRGREGMRYLAGGGKLFDEGNLLNPEKVSSYTYNAFLGNEPMSVHPNVKKYISYEQLSSLIRYGTKVWNKQLFLQRKSQMRSNFSENTPVTTLDEFCGDNNIQKGTSITQQKTKDGNIKVVAGGMDYAYFHNEHNREAMVVTISASGANAGYVNLWREKIWASDCSTVVGRSETETLFVYYYLKFIQAQITDLARGQAQPHVYIDDIRAIKIPKLTVDTQGKIVGECEAVEREIQLVQKSIYEIQQGIKSRFVEMFGDPVTNNFRFEHGTIRDIVTEVKYGTSKPSNEDGVYPYIRMNNITYDGQLNLSDLKYIDMPDSEIEKYVARKGDVLFNRSNSKELVGKTCVFSLDQPMVIAGYIIRVRLNESAIPEYLSALLNSDYGKSTLLAMCKKSIGQANINAQELQNIEILLPPLALQTRFADFVRKSDKAKNDLQQTLDELDARRKSLLAKYL